MAYLRKSSDLYSGPYLGIILSTLWTRAMCACMCEQMNLDLCVDVCDRQTWTTFVPGYTIFRPKAIHTGWEVSLFLTKTGWRRSVFTRSPTQSVLPKECHSVMG